MYFYEMRYCQTLFLTLQKMTVNINYKNFCVFVFIDKCSLSTFLNWAPFWTCYIYYLIVFSK